jgi:hypothetical protein
MQCVRSWEIIKAKMLTGQKFIYICCTQKYDLVKEYLDG